MAANIRVEQGDCRDVIKTLADASIDACVTDPPYSLVSIQKRFANAKAATETYAMQKSNPAYMSRGFMGKAWDTGEVAHDPAFWAEVLRVLKPGAHLVAFGSSRTHHRMFVAIEDAGFEIRDTICWVFGSGFPKNLGVSKKLVDSLPADALLSCDRCDWQIAQGSRADCSSYHGLDDGQFPQAKGSVRGFSPLQADARAHSHDDPHGDDREPEQASIFVDEGSAHRANGYSLDPTFRQLEDCQGSDSIQSDTAGSTSPALSTAEHKNHGHKSGNEHSGDDLASETWYTNLPQCPTCGKRGIPSGLGTSLKPAAEFICLARKPLGGTVAANVLAHGTGALNIDGCRVEGAPRTTHADGDHRQKLTSKGVKGGAWGNQDANLGGCTEIYAVRDGRWPANLIHDGSEEVLAAFPETDAASSSSRGLRHSGRHGGLADIGGNIKPGTNSIRGHDDLGGSAARFFYTAKADAGDRLRSKHPTVKPVDLMAYLIRLVTPPGGTVLDPFAGSGSTGMACMREGFDCLLIEREAEYVADIRYRLEHVDGSDTPLFTPPPMAPDQPAQLTLLDPYADGWSEAAANSKGCYDVAIAAMREQFLKDQIS